MSVKHNKLNENLKKMNEDVMRNVKMEISKGQMLGNSGRS